MIRSRWIAIIAAVFAGFGLLDSGYLTIKHLEGSYIRCGDECSAVLGSRYAEGIAGVPLAGFGAMAYATVLVAALFAAGGFSIGRRILNVLAPAMALVSLWLVYLQAFVIHSFCKYCMASAATSFVLAGLILIELMGRRSSGARHWPKD